MSNDMNPALNRLAIKLKEWPNGARYAVLDIETDQVYIDCGTQYGPSFDFTQWLQARRDLGFVMTEEEEVPPAQEWGKSVPEGVHSKYHREIKPGVWVDVYDVLHAWRVQNPALQHLVKKALQPGGRGHKTREQDMIDIVASALRAGELEGE
jgi:hypothetical protein